MESRHVYRISPWRRALLYGVWVILVVPISIIGLAIHVYALLAVSGVLTAILLPILIPVVRSAKLILTPEGVEARQAGATLITPWTNIAALRRVRGSEGFILREAMDGRGAERFADTAGVRLQGASIYDAGRGQLIAEQRFIPIEAFAYWLDHGDLGDVIAQNAPDLMADVIPGAIPVQGTQAPPRMSTSRKILFVIVVALLFAVGVLLANMQPETQAKAFRVLFVPVALGLLFSAARNLITVVRYIRVRRYGSGLLWVCMALIQIFCALVLIGDLTGHL